MFSISPPLFLLLVARAQPVSKYNPCFDSPAPFTILKLGLSAVSLESFSMFQVLSYGYRVHMFDCNL